MPTTASAAEHLAAALDADEERDTDEADRNPDQPEAADVLRRVDPAREERR